MREGDASINRQSVRATPMTSTRSKIHRTCFLSIPASYEARRHERPMTLTVPGREHLQADRQTWYANPFGPPRENPWRCLRELATNNLAVLMCSDRAERSLWAGCRDVNL